MPRWPGLLADSFPEVPDDLPTVPVFLYCPSSSNLHGVPESSPILRTHAYQITSTYLGTYVCTLYIHVNRQQLTACDKISYYTAASWSSHDRRGR